MTRKKIQAIFRHITKLPMMQKITSLISHGKKIDGNGRNIGQLSNMLAISYTIITVQRAISSLRHTAI